MPNKTLTTATAIVIIIIAAASTAWIYNNSNSTPTTTPTPTPEPKTSQEQARNDVIDQIQREHYEPRFLMTDLNWKGGKIATDTIGTETYMYESGFWTVLIEYPVVADPIYTVYVDFSRVSPSVSWQGTWQAPHNVTENHFTYTP